MQSLSKYAPYALAVLRIVTALLFIEHGTAKLFGFPAMPGSGHAGGLSPLMLIGALLEVFGGLAILVGFFTRPVAFILSGEMAVAYWAMHVPMGGFFPLRTAAMRQSSTASSSSIWCLPGLERGA